MTDRNDFSPIVETGVLEAASGVLGRLRRRNELGPVGSGLVRILLDENGAALAAGEQLSAGQKYWARSARSWVKVDVSEHSLSCDVPFTDPTGGAGLVAAVAVRCSVTDAALAAQQGVRGVRDYIATPLEDEVVHASGAVDPSTSSDPATALGELQQNADRALKERLSGEVRDLPAWLGAFVTSVTVRLNDTTAKHRDVLVEEKRRGELLDLTGGNEQKRTMNNMKVQAIVREQLGPHLADPAMRRFETVFADPSPEKIAAVVHQVDVDDRALVLNVLETFADNDLIDKDDPVFNATAEALINAIKGTPFNASGLLASGDRPAEIAEESEGPSAAEEDGEDDPDKDWKD